MLRKDKPYQQLSDTQVNWWVYSPPFFWLWSGSDSLWKIIYQIYIDGCQREYLEHASNFINTIIRTTWTRPIQWN